MLTPAKLSRIHYGIFDEDPGKTHAALYDAFPKAHGFSGRALDIDRFGATFVLGVALTYPLGGPSYHSVALLVSAHAEDWAVEQMQAIVHKLFTRMQAEGKLKSAQVTGKALEHLMMGCRALQIEEEPPRWAAFGFSSSDPIPDWLRAGLL